MSDDPKLSGQDYAHRVIMETLPPASPTDEDLIRHMVNRFLGWKLPEDFRPDGGIQFDPDGAKKLDPRNLRYEPYGTNLFDATQAGAMVRYMLEGNSTITDLTSRLEAVEGERKDPSDADYLAAHERLDDLARDRVRAAEARVAALEAGLRPFAQFRTSTLWPADGSEGDEVYVLTFNPPGHWKPNDLKGSDFRRARALLSQQPEQTIEETERG